RAEVAVFAGRRAARAGGARRVVAPGAAAAGLAGRGPRRRRADEAAHRLAGLLDLDRRDVEPGDPVRHRAGAGPVERHGRAGRRDTHAGGAVAVVAVAAARIGARGVRPARLV